MKILYSDWLLPVVPIQVPRYTKVIGALGGTKRVRDLPRNPLLRAPLRRVLRLSTLGKSWSRDSLKSALPCPKNCPQCCDEVGRAPDDASTM